MIYVRIAKSAIFVAIGLGLSATGVRAADDGSVFGSISGILGWDQNRGEKIDFRQRPRIVVPPNRQVLPEPSAAAERPPGWPVDKESAQRGGPRVASSSPDLSPDDPKRENLIQPPDGYRHATKDGPSLEDPDAKKGFNPLSYIGAFGKNLGFGD